MQKNLCAAALCLMLAACGGGGSSAPATVAQSAPIQSAPDAPKCTPLAVVKIQLFGDSTQWGIQTPVTTPWVQTPSNPTAMLQRAMDARFGVGAVKVDDRAVPATTAAELVSGTDGLNKPWPQSVDANITVVNMGINDMFVESTDAYKADLRKLNVTVYETPNPVSLTGWDRPEYAAAMRAVAAETNTPVADVDAYVRALPNWQSYLAGDQVHPTDTLYALIVTNVLQPKLEPMVAKLLCQ